MDELPGYTPQSLNDLLPIYRPPDASPDHIHTYTLFQTSPSTQLLSSSEDSPTTFHPLYIKSFKTGGFLNRKPHIIISQPSSSSSPPPRRNSSISTKTPSRDHPPPLTPTAEARFDIHGTGTTILYHTPSTQNPTAPDTDTDTDTPQPTPPTSRTQRLELSDSRMQILRTTVHDMPYWWQPLPGNKDVLELTNELEDVIARFVILNSEESLSSSSASSATAAPEEEGETTAERSNSVLSIPGSNPPTAAAAAGRSNSVFSLSLPSSSPLTERSNSIFSLPGSRRGSSPKLKPPRKASISKPPKTQNQTQQSIGSLYIVAPLVGADSEREEILCSAVVVVERTLRRRALLLGSVGLGGKGKGGGYLNMSGRGGVGRNGVPYVPQ